MYLYQAVYLISIVAVAFATNFSMKNCNENDHVGSEGDFSTFSTTTNDTALCRTLSGLELPVNVNYIITVTLQSVGNSTPGLIFNVKDDNNYEMIYFRTGHTNCIVRAFVDRGEYAEFGPHDCTGHKLKPDVWFDVVIEFYKDSYNVTINGTGPFAFPNHQPQDPSVGFIQGLKYKGECGYNCTFRFKSLKMDPDTEPQYFGAAHGEMHVPPDSSPNQLRIQRIELHALGRETGKYCFVALYFKGLYLGPAKIYVGSQFESVFDNGTVKFYTTNEDNFDVFFYSADMDFKANNYTILYNVFGCAVPTEDLSFICKNHTKQPSCARSTGYESDPHGNFSDAKTQMGWYAFHSCSGDLMPTTSPGKLNVCGSKNPVWLKPPKSGIASNGSSNGTACVYQDKDHVCITPWDLPVYNCNNQTMLYYLIPTPEQTAYCAGDLDFCDKSLNLTAKGSACAACSDGCRSHLLPTPYIIGISAAVLVLILVIAAVTVCSVKRYRSRQTLMNYIERESEVDSDVPYDRVI